MKYTMKSKDEINLGDSLNDEELDDDLKDEAYSVGAFFGLATGVLSSLLLIYGAMYVKENIWPSQSQENQEIRSEVNLTPQEKDARYGELSTYEQLSLEDKMKLEQAINPIIINAQRHTIGYNKKQKTVESWHNETVGFGYGCPTVSAVVSVEKYVAEIVKDMFDNRGNRIIHLFKQGNAPEMGKIIPLFYQVGLFGKGKEAYERLARVFQLGKQVPPSCTETEIF